MGNLKAYCAHWHGMFKGIGHLLQAPECVFCRGALQPTGSRLRKEILMSLLGAERPLAKLRGADSRCRPTVGAAS